MFSSIKAATVAVIAVAAGHAVAESHTVTFANHCGHGTVGSFVPTLISQNGAVLSTGAAYTSNGPLIGAIAYLQTGNCGFNGERCTLVETTLKNPTTPGSGSSTDLSLIPPHAFSVTTGFGYLGACAPAGADCEFPSTIPRSSLLKDRTGTSATCTTAFHKSTDTHVQVACQADNANLVVNISVN
ncbi:hypothetical protein K438DRAFT_1768887 [Mycena galopus ATCC 62051]|nr:hypothetical protein K438DRAFT_1768887 [Mycena galopus ATCC 62051]